MAKVGRPPLFKTPQEMEDAMNEYFDHCDNRIRHVYDKKSGNVIEIIDPEPYTMAGLAYSIGMDRTTLYNYNQKDEFIDTIKKARNKVQLDVERRLMEGQATGAIFNLKNNFGYVDKTETDLTSKGEQINSNVDPALAAGFASYLKQKKD